MYIDPQPWPLAMDTLYSTPSFSSSLETQIGPSKVPMKAGRIKDSEEGKAPYIWSWCGKWEREGKGKISSVKNKSVEQELNLSRS